MVAQILADSLHFVANFDADAFEQLGLPDARQFEPLR
jgi:hypothetical protein